MFYLQNAIITLDPRLLFSDSIRGIFPGPATKSIRVYWMVSQLAGLQWLTVLSMLIRGITMTLTGDWHSGWLAALSPSIILRNSLLTEGRIQHISVLWMWWLTKNYVSALKHNCNVMALSRYTMYHQIPYRFVKVHHGSPNRNSNCESGRAPLLTDSSTAAEPEARVLTLEFVFYVLQDDADDLDDSDDERPKGYGAKMVPWE